MAQPVQPVQPAQAQPVQVPPPPGPVAPPPAQPAALPPGAPGQAAPVTAPPKSIAEVLAQMPNNGQDGNPDDDELFAQYNTVFQPIPEDKEA